ncbi:transglycosylase domain-containing protein [Fictibacillus iocasae]|uniref:Transglycosylase domain-containing protein n=1 Tax=Fictibacillus iocasae TaxID=2715437 RepID=A0ABW2NQP0_9BACL
MSDRVSLRKKKKALLWVRRTIIITILMMVVSAMTGGAMIYAYMDGTPNLNEDDLRIPRSSMIYDSNDKFVMYVTSTETREYAPIKDIPQHVQNAFIATEDVRFRQHNGVDVKRIFGAAVANVKDGFGSEGASTITQQVVKNSVLSSEKTVKRKVQEAYLAVQLEREYSKDQILEMYLNKIYFGQSAYGVSTAAKVYFNKPLSKLTVAEAALLAGLPQRPSDYNPYVNPDKAENRRNIVLSLMHKHGFISEAEKKEAASIPVKKMLSKPSKEKGKYEAYIQQVIKELREKGISDKEIYEGGLKIYTNLDPVLQTHTEQVLSSDKFVKYPDAEFQAGTAVVDTQTGAIRALGGNRQAENAKVEKGFNYATDSKRQPGSTAKPILDYGPAIEYLKWSTYKQLKDEPLKIGEKEFKNWDNEFHGTMSMRQALKMSYNIPAIKAFLEVGDKKAKAFASGLGLEFKTLYPAYAIGGFNEGVSPLQMAGAYSAFGNEGVYHKPSTLRKIGFPNGNEMKLENKGKKAMSDYTAYMVTDMMKTVVEEGTGMSARIPGLEIAGKTGTTNLPEGIVGNGASDSWFVGYTTLYTTSVWTGYNKTDQDHYLTKSDQAISRDIFRQIMTLASKDKKTKPFTKPDSVEEIYVNKDTGRLSKSSYGSSNVSRELMVKGTALTDVVKPELKPKKKQEKRATPSDAPKQDKPVKKDPPKSDKPKKNEDKKPEDKKDAKPPVTPPPPPPPPADPPPGDGEDPPPPPDDGGGDDGGGTGEPTEPPPPDDPPSDGEGDDKDEEKPE